METEERVRADLLAPQPQDQPHAHEKGDEHLCVEQDGDKLHAPLRIRQNTSAYVTYAQQTIRQQMSFAVCAAAHTSAYVSVCMHSSGYVSIRESRR